ncbi:hypothetical protein H5410_051186 [Solanum commersonii]|uniref:AIPP2-like SPOC-like domain-containing protein n=1 Tax=Solanum commersonii TaxID=4109 RepID=A0A9J5WYV9_SOLCO|nr:hypothetical protein H5410_051186 [Solanum commersonii]
MILFRGEGCYNIWNNEYTLDIVVAHLSDKASQNVSEKEKLLQLHLHFEMVPKEDLWPKYFNRPQATVDDIELFFFPSEARDAVNDRAPTEDDAQVMTDELGRGKKIRKIIARFDDYI